MSIDELIAVVQTLSREEKRELLNLLLEELAMSEDSTDETQTAQTLPNVLDKAKART